ncbi:surface protein [Marivirga sericea]|uniref:Surface protein n=1 Tax=Marivirga sericea TaxID=1028 RepID=A0A1X7I6M9_9BACT|nr:BspA family leucine-rich repeat surface protein [Marivirga sericea]SMG09956.1 surface protein [Marivirga sericea]
MKLKTIFQSNNIQPNILGARSSMNNVLLLILLFSTLLSPKILQQGADTTKRLSTISKLTLANGTVLAHSSAFSTHKTSDLINNQGMLSDSDGYSKDKLLLQTVPDSWIKFSAIGVQQINIPAGYTDISLESGEDATFLILKCNNKEFSMTLSPENKTLEIVTGLNVKELEIGKLPASFGQNLKINSNPVSKTPLTVTFSEVLDLGDKGLDVTASEIEVKETIRTTGDIDLKALEGNDGKGKLIVTGALNGAQVSVFADRLSQVFGEITSNKTSGLIQILSKGDVEIGEKAYLDASAPNGGGTILIGGDFKGKGSIPNAQKTYIAPNATITANATADGDGGRIIVWADDFTQVYGNLSAKGTGSGKGGFIETSGKINLDVRTVPDVSAESSNGGEWLLDPRNIDIVAGGGNTNINTTSPFNPTGDNAQLGVNLITSALGSGDVTINTNTGGAQQGNINLLVDIDYNGSGAGNTLTLNAENNINLQGSIFDGVTGDSESISVVLNANGFMAGSTESIVTHGGTIDLIAANVIQFNNLSSQAASGAGGNINVVAGGDIDINGTVNSDGGGLGAGTISIQSTGGNLNSSASPLSLNASDQNGSTITLTIAGSILTPLSINTVGGAGGGGDISITTSGIGPTTINTISPNGLGASGNVTFNVGGDLTLPGFNLNGGLISGGILNITAGGDVSLLGAFTNNGVPNGGAIDITSTSGNISVTSLASSGGTDFGGAITLNAVNGTVTATGNISTNGGIGGGGVDIDGGIINVLDLNSGGPALNLNSFIGNITCGDLATEDSFSGSGPINISSANNITTGTLDAATGGPGSGPITLLGNDITINGNVDASAGSTMANGNTIDITGNIVDITGSFLATGDGGGGSILIDAQTLSKPVGNLIFDVSTSASSGGAGGSIAINSNQVLNDLSFNVSENGVTGGAGGSVSLDIASGTTTIAVLNMNGTNGGGDFTAIGSSNLVFNTNLNSNITGANGAGGNILIDVNTISFGAGLGINTTAVDNGGDIDLTAAGDISINGTVDASATGFPSTAGEITITSTAGNLNSTATPLELIASANEGNNITLDIFGNINQPLDINTQPGVGSIFGNLNVTTGGAAPTTFSSIQVSGAQGAGNITISTVGDLIFNTDVVASGSFGAPVIIQSLADITFAAGLGINTSGTNGGGDVALTSDGTVTIPNGIITNGGSAGSGDLTISALGNITTGEIETVCTVGDGASGNIDLNSSAGSVNFSTISAEYPLEGGGNVSITALNEVIGSGSFSNLNGNNASISTVGGTSSGSVFISHNNNNPQDFEINQGATTNGLFSNLAADPSLSSDNFLNTTVVGGNYLSGDGNVLIRTPGPPFITTWRTTTASESINIPTFGGGYLYDVDWGDGNTSTAQTGDATHTYASAGTYTVSISGNFPQIYFNDPSQLDPNTAKIQTIEQWGDIAWRSMESAFRGCSNLTYNAVDIPDLSGVSSMQSMFESASVFNGDIAAWDVSTVTSMQRMFDGAEAFNQNISIWDVSLVENFVRMFAGANDYNSPLEAWNVIGATDMSGMFAFTDSFNQPLDGWANKLNGVLTVEGMFQQANAFNQDLSNWDVSTVVNFDRMFISTDVFNGNIANWTLTAAEDMSQMFSDAQAFNSDISGWDVSNVTNMSGMFSFAIAFNRDIGSWDVSNVTDMGASPSGAFEDGMFRGATAFDQDLGGWDIGNVLDMEEMLDNSGMSTANYEATLLGWGTIDGGAGETAIPSSITLGAVGLTYCDATGRNELTGAPNNWIINGDAPLVDATAIPTASQLSVCDGSSFDFSIGANVQTAFTYKLYSNFTNLSTRGNELGTWTEGNAVTPITLTDGVDGIILGDNILTVVGEDAGQTCETILDALLTITVNSVPTVVIAGDATICEGTSTDLTFTLTGTGPYDVTYSDGATDVVLTGINDGYIESVTPTATTTYSLVSVIDANNCSGTAVTGSATVIVNPEPTVIISGDATICEGESSDLSFTLTGTGPYDVTYNDGAADVVLTGIDNGHIEQVTPTATTTYSLVSVTDANSCAATALAGSATININPLPTVAIAGDVTICEGESSDLTFTLTGTGPFEVTYNDGAADVVLTGIDNGHVEAITPTETTTYTLVSASDASGCAATAVTGSATITVNPVSIITLDAQGPFCLSDASTSLVATPSGGIWSGTGITDGTVGTFDPNTAGVGTFTITYTISELGCSNEESIDITVLETPDASISAAGPFCSGDAPVTLSAINPGGSWSGTGITDEASGIFDPTSATIGENIITYTLEVGSCQDVKTTTILVNESPEVSIDEVAPICLESTPITLIGTPSGGQWSGSGITDPDAGTFDPTVAGIGISLINYTVNIDGCSGASEINIEVLSAPDDAAEINGPNDLCVGDEVTYTTSAINGAESYQWETPSGSVTTDTPELTYTAQDAGQISVAGVNSCGVGVPSNISYNLAPPATADFSFMVSPLSDLEYQFTSTSTGEVNNWSWDFGDGSTSASENPTHTYELPGNYTVSLTVSNGPCEDVVTQTVIVNTEIIITIGNIITANNNGQNDFIYIENIEKYEDHQVQLLNRWGKVVFSSTSFSNTPSTIANRPELESGNYVCIVIIRFAGMQVKQQQLITVVK